MWCIVLRKYACSLALKLKILKFKKVKNKKKIKTTHTHTQKKSYDFQTTVIYFSTKPGGADGSSWLSFLSSVYSRPENIAGIL